jgi:hypothetical protein
MQSSLELVPDAIVRLDLDMGVAQSDAVQNAPANQP